MGTPVAEEQEPVEDLVHPTVQRHSCAGSASYARLGEPLEAARGGEVTVKKLAIDGATVMQKPQSATVHRRCPELSATVGEHLKQVVGNQDALLVGTANAALTPDHSVGV